MREPPSAVRLPRWLRLVGGVVVIPSGILAARLVWEQTLLTWRSGPQMVGFSLAHGGMAFLLIWPMLLLIWISVILVAVIVNLVRRRQIARTVWFDFGAALVVLALLSVPYRTWQWLFVGRLAASPDVGEFMSYAAATGDIRTLEALLSRGVSVDVKNRSGGTALHAAVVEDQVEVVKLLLSKGAPVDAVNRFGDSPLSEARESSEAARILEAHGAHRIRGSDSQRERTLEEIVVEDSESDGR